MSYHTQKPRFTHNLISYNKRLARAAQNVDKNEAFRIFSEIKNTKLSPDIYSFNSLFNACIKGYDFKGGLSVFESMKEAGIKPTETNSTVINFLMVQHVFSCWSISIKRKMKNLSMLFVEKDYIATMRCSK